jgi:hypothetical protein
MMEPEQNFFSVNLNSCVTNAQKEVQTMPEAQFEVHIINMENKTEGLYLLNLAQYGEVLAKLIEVGAI